MFFPFIIRNVSRKFEEDCLKNEGGDRFLMSFLISVEIDRKKFDIPMYGLQIFWGLFFSEVLK